MEPEGSLPHLHVPAKWSKLTYLLTYLLTYSMEQSPSEANRFSTSQKNSPNFMEPEGSLPHSRVPAKWSKLTD